jgi:hypothetical protein
VDALIRGSTPDPNASANTVTGFDLIVRVT